MSSPQGRATAAIALGDILRSGNVSGGNVFCSFSGDRIVVIGVNHAEFVLKVFKSPFWWGLIP